MPLDWLSPFHFDGLFQTLPTAIGYGMSQN